MMDEKIRRNIPMTDLDILSIKLEAVSECLCVLSPGVSEYLLSLASDAQTLADEYKTEIEDLEKRLSKYEKLETEESDFDA